MKINEVEGIEQDLPQEVQFANLKAVVLTNIEGAIREAQKADFVEVQRGFGIDVDDGVAEDAPIESAREEYLAAVLQLASNVEEMSPEDKAIIEKLVQTGQGTPQDADAQTRVDMDQAAERQAQGNQDLTMGEMRVKEFTLNEEQTRQAIQMFGQRDEKTPADVRATAAELSAALPQQLAEIARRLEDAPQEEAFDLQARRLDLVAQVDYYESFVKVLDVVAPAPDQNALTEADMNLRAERVANEPRYAGSPGTGLDGVSESRTAMHYNEYNAAEVGLRMRTDYDPVLGYARSVEWDVGVQIGNFETRPERFGRDERLVDIGAAQAVHSDLTNTRAERGHAVGQQFSGGDDDIAWELMKTSNMWVMRGRSADGVNQGVYKDVEDRIVQMRAEYPQDAITVRVEAVIEGEPQFLVTARGKELVVPDRFDFTITRTPADGRESVVERATVLNREEQERRQ